MYRQHKMSVDNATSCLTVDSVSLKDMTVNTYEDFDSEILPEDLYDNGQSFSGLRRVQSFTDDDFPELTFYRFSYSIGLRFLSTEDKAKLKQKEIDLDDANPYLEFKATFIAIYRSTQELEQDEVRDFGERYVRFHVWPYWRELVQSSCARLQLPPLVVPPYRV